MEIALLQNYPVVSTDNKSFYVDIRDEICEKFGFHHKDIALNPKKDVEVIIIGVAPGKEGYNVLWYIRKDPFVKGKVCYWGGCVNLLEAGFKFLRKSE